MVVNLLIKLIGTRGTSCFLVRIDGLVDDVLVR